MTFQDMDYLPLPATLSYLPPVGFIILRPRIRAVDAGKPITLLFLPLLAQKETVDKPVQFDQKNKRL
jgi:hypothetical protein